MADVHGYSPLVGRTAELRDLHHGLCDRRAPVLVITGPSGIGKTALIDSFAASSTRHADHFTRVWFHSLYRTSWTSTLTDFRRELEWVPRNATVEEIQQRIIDSCQATPTLLILDNADEGNIARLALFVERWRESVSNSSLVITAQPYISAQLPAALPVITLHGIESDAAILDLCGELAEKFPEHAILEVGRLLGGNPQQLLFLSWIQPEKMEDLRDYAENLKNAENQIAVEELIETSDIPGLFFLALGIHRSAVVTDELLAFLWDQFGARGTDAYVRDRNKLQQKKVLLPIDQDVFRLHESVQVQLEKALAHRISAAGIPHFHHYFAEFYEKALRASVSTKNLTHFIYHSLAAHDYALALRTSVEGAAAQALATRGAAVLVRQELEKLDTAECLREASPLEEARLCLRLGGICNDLSDHEATLRYMERAARLLRQCETEQGSLQRQVWYYNAVAFCNLGQSDRCLQEYFKIVDSCTEPRDDLACLSLGYLAHDLKYRDMELALELGRLAVDWARSEQHKEVLPKNICSYAESLAITRQEGEAVRLFLEAAELCDEAQRQRELGRIETNLGFALSLQRDDRAAGYLSSGKAHSTAVGDRRRVTQAILYSGVETFLAGAHTDGARQFAQSADLLYMLQDGRYFVLALCWTLQAAGYTPREYPTRADKRATAILTETDNAHLLAYSEAHPAFRLYYEFWWRHLSAILVET